MKLIIAGGRNYEMTIHDWRNLTDIKGVTEIVSGGASGADKGGEEYAASVSIPVKSFPADWEKHGRCAGPMRNRQMAEYADAVALFPGGKGTASMHREAVKAGIEIFDFR